MTDLLKKPVEQPTTVEQPEDFINQNKREEEKKPEKKSGLPQEAGTRETETAPLAKKRPSFLQRRQVPTGRDEITVKVEKIMEEGLKDAYAKLSPIGREEFKIKGEKTAAAIRDLLRSAHIKVKKIFRLILEWLKMLPGANRFFLEQEAKVKTDKIILLHQRTRDSQ